MAVPPRISLAWQNINKALALRAMVFDARSLQRFADESCPKEERERQASIEVNARQNERNVFANVAQALDGNADFSVSEETQISEREERLQRDTQAAQELIRQFDSQRSQNPCTQHLGFL